MHQLEVLRQFPLEYYNPELGIEEKAPTKLGQGEGGGEGHSFPLPPLLAATLYSDKFYLTHPNIT